MPSIGLRLGASALRSSVSILGGVIPPVTPLTISGTAPAATVGSPYSFRPTVSGGMRPYTFQWLEIALPSGLALDSDTGETFGTPTNIESVTGMTLRVIDALGNTADLINQSIIVNASSAFDFVNTPLSLGRLANEQGTVANGRYFRVSSGGASNITGSWNLSNVLTDGGAYTFTGKIRFVDVATGQLSANSYRALVRLGNDVLLTTANPSSVSTTFYDNTFAGEVDVRADFTFNAAQPFVGVVGIAIPSSVRIELVGIQTPVTVPRFLPWKIVPEKSKRTLSINDVPLAVNQTLDTPIYIAPGATKAYVKIGYVAAPVLMTAYILPSKTATGLVGFTLNDIKVQDYYSFWRPGDDPFIWVTIDILNPKTVVGNRFKISFGGEGIAGSVACFFEIAQDAVNELPATLPYHRPPYRLDVSGKTPQIALDIPNMKWSASGYLNNANSGTPVWRARPSHGNSNLSSNGENGLYVNTDQFPNDAIEPQSIKVDSNNRTFLQLRAEKFPQPVVFSGKNFPFQASLMQAQRMPEWCHRRGLYRATMAIPSRHGCWSAFWCVGRRPSGANMWPPEIDFFEAFNGAFGAEYTKTMTSSTQHLGEFGSNKREVAHGVKLEMDKMGFANDFDFNLQGHEYACLIEDEWITHFIDGIETVCYRNMTDDPDGSTDYTFYPIFNIAVKEPESSTFDQGTNLLKLYAMDYYAPGSAQLVPFTDTKPWANRKMTPDPDMVTLPVNLTTAFVGAGTFNESLTTGAEFSDDFNRADSNLEASSDWERVDGIANQLRIISNRLVTSATATANATAYLVSASKSISTTDHFAEVDWLHTNNTSGWLLIRATDSKNFVGVQKNTNYVIFKCINGTFTQFTGNGGVVTAGDRIRLEAQGQTVRLIKNGTGVFSATLGAGELTSGRTGFMSRTNSTNPAFDNFKTGGL